MPLESNGIYRAPVLAIWAAVADRPPCQRTGEEPGARDLNGHRNMKRLDSEVQPFHGADNSSLVLDGDVRVDHRGLHT